MYDELIKELIGVPFVAGGRDRKTGLDCWGLVMEVYKIMKPSVTIPDVNASCVKEDSDEVEMCFLSEKESYIKAEPKTPLSIMGIKHNDPIYVNHVGVFLGDNKFIHTRRKVGVAVDSVESMAWKRKIEGYYIPREGMDWTK